MTTTIAEYTATEAALADFRTKYKDAVFPVATTKGMTEAKKARADLREHRVALEKERVRIKAPALERCRQIDSEAKRITAELEALEGPIDEQIKAEEQRKEREKAERERLERERVEAMHARFNAIKALPLRAVDATAPEIEAIIAEAEAMPTDDFPEDMVAAAKFEIRLAVSSLRAALDKRLAADAEQERIRAEREELERLRAEQAAVIAERERLAAAERERVAAEERRLEEQARAEREAIERAEREAREAEQRRIDAERAEARRKEDAERAKAAEKLRQEQAALAAERRRIEDEKAAAAKAARDAEITNATLLAAANEAVQLLQAEGYGNHIVTQKLAAAVAREPEARRAA